jgi:hypothetical protein
MARKFFAAIVLAAIAVFTVPTAAMASGYVPPGDVSSSGGNESSPGEGTSITFSTGSFDNNETISVRATGDPVPTLGVIGTASHSYTASAIGGVTFRVTVPTNATANSVYTIIAVGDSSGNVGTYRITVVLADAAVADPGGIAFTGTNVSMLVVWGGAGLLALGAAMVIVFGVVRRQRASV